ncbi:hypothetical protein PENPOL_c002G08597 [Penicillium polonicum]|uniref:Uncharacterized protein n=1 Tax=Penicillium polonicum TaxID=60169 RepID=A0A1V6NX50_PENPO|nr:hypothetical protein PENPOL_c002G08597 [Penicillium polonicum]
MSTKPPRLEFLRWSWTSVNKILSARLIYVVCLKCSIRISGTSPIEIHFKASEIWTCSLSAVSGAWIQNPLLTGVPLQSKRSLELFAADRQRCRIKVPLLTGGDCKAGEF